MALTRAYAADIIKAERDANGDLIVYGKATGPELDLDEQICDPTWLRSAMPDWAKWGNIREMHQPIVAGVGLETAEDNDEWYVKSQVVDDNTAKKIEAGALRGYSVGIKNAKVIKDATAPGGRIVGGQIVEISYVDRPCNPTATLFLGKLAGNELDPAEAPTDKAVNAQGAVDEAPDIDLAEQVLQLIAKLIQSEASEMAIGEWDESCDIGLLLEAAYSMKCFRHKEMRGAADGETGMTTAYLSAEADLIKRKVSADERKSLAKEGKALPDGSYPIANAEDLKNAAILARSGHGDTGAAKRLIARRAKELGVPNPLANDKGAEPDVKETPAAEEPQVNEELEALVKSAVAEQIKPYEAANEELRAELEQLKATAIPGGPVMTAPEGARNEKRRGEELQKAAYFRRMAGEVNEPELRLYYEGRAKAAEEVAGGVS